MVTMPDGSEFEMSWKKAKYINNDNYIVFDIVPMFKGKDIVIIPSKKKWNKIINIFSFDEREEIIFLLERINWKRNIRIIEMDIEPVINKDINSIKGSLESTPGYKRICRENLFDVDSKLSSEQVKNIYINLEQKFAKSVSGKVIIDNHSLIRGSVLNEISIPILNKNPNVMLEFS